MNKQELNHIVHHLGAQLKQETVRIDRVLRKARRVATDREFQGFMRRVGKQLRSETARIDRVLRKANQLEKAKEKDMSNAELTKVIKALNKSLRKLSERGSDDDHRQMIADLIASDDSPFMPDDEDSLRFMSRETLRKMRDKFLGKVENVDDDEDENKGMSPQDSIKQNSDDFIGLSERKRRVAQAILASASDNEARRLRADAFCARDALFKKVGAAVGAEAKAKKNARVDPAVEAMTAFSGAGITSRYNR